MPKPIYSTLQRRLRKHSSDTASTSPNLSVVFRQKSDNSLTRKSSLPQCLQDEDKDNNNNNGDYDGDFVSGGLKRWLSADGRKSVDKIIEEWRKQVEDTNAQVNEKKNRSVSSQPKTDMCGNFFHSRGCVNAM